MAELNRVLLVNDDVEDSIRIQRRLPKDMEVEIATQSQARCLKSFDDFDLIVIDNDANDLKEAKGPETLRKVMTKGTQAQLLFTSFQPGWVSSEVYQTKSVRVVKTDELLPLLKEEFGLKLRPTRKSQSRTQPQITLMITYNPVKDYDEGVYCEGKLIILAFDKYAREQAKDVLRQKLLEIYRTFEWRSDRDMIKNIFVYDGLNGGEWPARLAAILGHDIRMKIQLMACQCEWDRKIACADTMYIDLYQVECGGEHTLGAIADLILGIKRPDVNYDRVPVPMEVIEQGAKKFSL